MTGSDLMGWMMSTFATAGTPGRKTSGPNPGSVGSRAHQCQLAVVLLLDIRFCRAFCHLRSCAYPGLVWYRSSQEQFLQNGEPMATDGGNEVHHS